jgi:RimJ/RimL family protein N-acetyltransferase
MKVIIRPLTIDHAKTSWKWRNDPSIWKYTGNKPNRPITIKMELEWLRNVLAKENESRFAICVSEEMNYIGNVQLTDITEEDAQFHIFIGEKQFHGMGVGTCATKLLLKYAFNTLNLKNVYLYVNSDNIKAIKSYEKCGFKTIEIHKKNLKMIIKNE